MTRPAFRSVTSGDSAGTTNQQTLSKPSGLAVDDLLVMFSLIRGGANPITGFPTSNWVDQGSSGDAVHTRVVTKVADASDVAASSFTFTWTATGAKAALLFCISGIDPVGWENQLAVASIPIGTTAAQAPSVTPTTNETLLLALWGIGSDDVTVSSSDVSNLTKEGRVNATIAGGTTDGPASGVASGVKVATFGASDTANGGAFTLAIAPLSSMTHLAPDGIITQTNLSGALSVIQDDPSTADTTWWTAP